ncbi:MAG: hypothetical protein RI975_932 [Pseudomonadota bacterium]
MCMSILFIASTMLSACGSSPEQRWAEENQRIQTQRARYDWQVNFCRKKGITPQDSSFTACMNWAKAELDVIDARAARCSPNWFGVAGAFAQPQLGGFAASAGSASQELARQQSANGCN